MRKNWKKKFGRRRKTLVFRVLRWSFSSYWLTVWWFSYHFHSQNLGRISSSNWKCGWIETFLFVLISFVYSSALWTLNGCYILSVLAKPTNEEKYLPCSSSSIYFCRLRGHLQGEGFSWGTVKMFRKRKRRKSLVFRVLRSISSPFTHCMMILLSFQYDLIFKISLFSFSF